jgi:hypothetical protein
LWKIALVESDSRMPASNSVPKRTRRAMRSSTVINPSESASGFQGKG